MVGVDVRAGAEVVEERVKRLFEYFFSKRVGSNGGGMNGRADEAKRNEGAKADDDDNNSNIDVLDAVSGGGGGDKRCDGVDENNNTPQHPIISDIR